jgi:hypothetical protein
MVSLTDIALLVFFGAIAVWMILVGAGRLRTWNQLRGMNAQQVTDAGFVEVEGTATQLTETTTSPMTNTESLVYNFSISQREQDDDGTTQWRTVKSESDSVPFVIEMDDTSVVVDATQLDGEDTYLGGPEEHKGDKKHSESRLDPGDSAYVAGTAVHADRADCNTNGQQFVLTADSDSPIPIDLAGLLTNQFLLSDGGEEHVGKQQLKNGLLLFVFGCALLVGIFFLAPVP